MAPFASLGRAPLLVLAALSLAAVGAIDFATGVEIRVYPLYFVPVSFVCWRLGRREGIAFAVLSALVWEFSNDQAGMPRTSALVTVWNTLAHLTAFLVVALLMAELHDRLERERALSKTDPMTGLANGPALRDRAALEVERARRWKRPLTLAYLDLDDFKLVNDSHGHAVGDEVLRTAAVSLRSALRSTDLAARMGGDEFVLLLPETDVAGARVVLENARERLREAMDRGGWKVTASIGSVTSTFPSDAEALMEEADRLMYEVKKAGKASVLMAEATEAGTETGA